MISVIIPVYNRSNLLPITINSILSQSVLPTEIIIVDDGSTDNTYEVAKSFGNLVKVIRQSNLGPSLARNNGFRVSSGQFIHFFDSDDIALSNKHEIQVKALIENSADIAYGPWVKGQIINNYFLPEDLIFQQNGLPTGNLVKALLTNWSIVTHACLFTRNIVEKSGGFPEKLFIGEDQLFFLKCLLMKAKVIHTPNTLELYRTNNNFKITNSTLNENIHIREWSTFLIEAQKCCNEHNINPSNWFGFRRRAWEAMHDLEKNKIYSYELKFLLKQLYYNKNTNFFYWLEQKFQRKRSSLMSYFGLGRSHPYFRAGNFNQKQINLLNNWEQSLH